MHRSYDDIRDRIDERPQWFDDHGVPRYVQFHPRHLGVYDRCAVLVLIQCQGCHERFYVGVGVPRIAISHWAQEPVEWSVEKLANGFHYGDPPRHGGCAGETMNCEDIVVVEAWQRESLGDWERLPEHEGVIDDA